MIAVITEVARLLKIADFVPNADIVSSSLRSSSILTFQFSTLLLHLHLRRASGEE